MARLSAGPRQKWKMKVFPYAANGCLLVAMLVSGCSTSAETSTPTASPPMAPRPTIVSLTFDDGDADNFPAAAVLGQHDLRATFYIASGLVGTRGYMTWRQLQELRDQGHEIGGHTLDHVNVGNLEGTALRHEICDDRQNLQAHGFQPVSFAYPFGGYNDAAKSMVRECGYSDARRIGAGPDEAPPSDAYALRAFPYVVSDTDSSKLQRYVSGTRKEGGGWVILIFHHVCEACDYFSVRPDVFSHFIGWLADQQSAGNLRVRTVRQVVLDSPAP